MRVGFAFRIEADTREKAYEIYSKLCDGPDLCWEDNDGGMWDYCYGPKPLYDEPGVDQENTYWSDGNGTNVYNGITWEEFKNQGIPPHKLEDMLGGGFISVDPDGDWSSEDANSFRSYPIPEKGEKGAWFFVTCAHI